MQILMWLFDITNTAFRLFGYSISYVELIGVIFGFSSVYYAAKVNILTWPTGLLSLVFLFVLFFQVQLYADMSLQIYFFFVTLYGWFRWRSDADNKNITALTNNARWVISGIVAGLTLGFGVLFANIHLVFPEYFKVSAAYPYTDSFVMVLSIVATTLLAMKKVEAWFLWVLVDLICVFLFFDKGVAFLGLEYLIFLVMAVYGYMNWNKNMTHDQGLYVR